MLSQTIERRVVDDFARNRLWPHSGRPLDSETPIRPRDHLGFWCTQYCLVHQHHRIMGVSITRQHQCESMNNKNFCEPVFHSCDSKVLNCTRLRLQNFLIITARYRSPLRCQIVQATNAVLQGSLQLYASNALLRSTPPRLHHFEVRSNFDFQASHALFFRVLPAAHELSDQSALISSTKNVRGSEPLTARMRMPLRFRKVGGKSTGVNLQLR